MIHTNTTTWMPVKPYGGIGMYSCMYSVCIVLYKCPYFANIWWYIPLQLATSGWAYIGGQPPCEQSRTVRTGPNLNSTQNGDPKDTYLQCAGRNKQDEVMYIPKRVCKSLLKSRDMTVCIWHKSVRTLPKMVRTRFEQTRFGLHLVCKCCEAMFRCCNIICELGAFLFA